MMIMIEISMEHMDFDSSSSWLYVYRWNIVSGHGHSFLCCNYSIFESMWERLFYIYLMCHTMHSVVRGQLSEVSPLLLPSSRGLNSGRQTWQQMTSPNEPSTHPRLWVFKPPKLPVGEISSNLDNIIFALMKNWQRMQPHEIHVWFLHLHFTFFIVPCIKSISVISPSMQSKKDATSAH